MAASNASRSTSASDESNGIGGLIFRDRLSGSAGDLKVGDCFDDPPAGKTVADVQHHPCTESHTGEVIYVGDMPSNTAYPGENGFDAFAVQNCVPAFQTYTGEDVLTSEVLTMNYFYPKDDAWAKGNHKLTCYAVRADGQPVTSSFKKTN